MRRCKSRRSPWDAKSKRIDSFRSLARPRTPISASVATSMQPTSSGFTGEVFYGGTDTLKNYLKAGTPVVVWIDLGVELGDRLSIRSLSDVSGSYGRSVHR